MRYWNKCNAACLLMLASLAACGGGGGGGGGGNGGGATEPPSPTVVYTGNAQPAVVDKTNAVTFASHAIVMRPITEFAESLWVDRPASSGPIDQTLSGPIDGTARATGTYDASAQTGYLDVTFSDFSGVDFTVNGRYIQRYRPVASPQAGFIYSEVRAGTMEFGRLQLISALGTLELTGSVAVSGPNSRRFDVDLLVSDSSGSAVYYEDCSIDFSTVRIGSNGFFGLALAGTINDGVLGAVQMTPTRPITDLALFEPAGFAVGQRDGGFQMTSDGALLELRVLSRNFAALTLDIDGDLRPEEGRRVSWAELAGLPATGNSVSSGPIANAGNELRGNPGFDYTVIGLYSHDDDGDWLTYDWSLVAAPFGSQASLVDADLPITSFVPDLDGEYLLELRVTDGIDTSRTSVKAFVETAPQLQIPQSTFTGALEIAPPFEPNIPIRVDGRPATNRPHGPEPRWFAEAPDGTNPPLNPGVDQFDRELLSDQRGPHRINMLANGGLTRFLPGFGLVDVAIGTTLQSTPVDIFGGTTSLDTLPVDYNGDGRLDLVVVVNELGGGFLTMTAEQGGGFSLSPVVAGGRGEAAAGDLNGDSRTDIAIADEDGIYISFQESDGSYQTSTLLPYPDLGGFGLSSARDIGIGDIDGDGRADLTALYSTPQEVLVWLQDGAGQLGAPEAQGLPFFPRFAGFGDINGDNRMDAVLSVRGSQVDPIRIQLALGQADGSFSIDSELLLGNSSNAPFVILSDVNDDDRIDIITQRASDVVIFEQQPDGSMLEAAAATLPNLFFPSTATAADVDNDGDIDIIACSTFDMAIGLRDDLGNYDFYENGDCRHSLISLTSSPTVLDFNGDGSPDIISNGDALFTVRLAGFTNFSQPVD